MEFVDNPLDGMCYNQLILPLNDLETLRSPLKIVHCGVYNIIHD